MAISSYSMEDNTFPKTFELLPCPKTLNNMKLLKTKLNLLYKNKLKKQPQELFMRKTQEAVTLPEYSEVNSVMELVNTQVPEALSNLEEQFGTSTNITVASEVGSSAMQRMVSKWWRVATCGLAVQVLWVSKHRSGVVSNMLGTEWATRKKEDGKTVVTVSTHKTGDREPALIVLSDELAIQIERYYPLRQRVRTTAKEFFITNKGQRLVKIYDELNKLYHTKLSANIFRRMVESQSRGHDRVTCTGVAKALQHSEDTALRHYHVPDAKEAIRRQRHIDVVDETAVFEDVVSKEFDNLFPYAPYANWTDAGIRERIMDSDAYAAHPTATITDALVQRVKARYNDAVFGERAEILVGHMRANYNKNNVTKHAVIDTAKERKLHYFLNGDQEKMCRHIIAKFN
ncbi:uncharacterized protein LOC115034927 [Acyrthosiphon pisum]|uniref:Uncharacterized protein n=1 Tax=Acyrthosiphon pisum TaxID=7029 RepID=A0A8R2JWJ9_ACYPI|nr:uncharacterized protein LOC115034927 [Acyrthosiphon pisum]